MKLNSLLLGLCVSLLAACSTLSGDAKLEQLSETTYKYTLTETWNQSYMDFREHLMNTAREYCAKKDQGSQLLDSATQEKGKGFEGVIIFRCVGKMKDPNKPLFFANDE